MVKAGGQEGEPTRSDATGNVNVAPISGECNFCYKTHCLLMGQDTNCLRIPSTAHAVRLRAFILRITATT